MLVGQQSLPQKILFRKRLHFYHLIALVEIFFQKIPE